MLSPAGAAPPPPPPPAVGAWVDYDWQTPGQPKSRLRYAVVAGDASGRRRIEITVLKGDQLARFGYDLLADGSRERQVAQFGAQGPVVLMPTAPVDLPELPSVDAPSPRLRRAHGGAFASRRGRFDAKRSGAFRASPASIPG